MSTATQRILDASNQSALQGMLKKQAALLEEMSLRRAQTDVLYWLQNLTMTEDKQVKSKEKDVIFSDARELVVKRPFPRKDFFYYILAALKRKSKMGIWKSRTMMQSWLVAGYCAHLAFTRPATEVVVQSADEPKALEFIEKVKVLWVNSHPKLRESWPVPKDPYSQPAASFDLDNRSRFIGLACGPLGPHKIRSYHPTIYVADEAAFMPELDACIASALGAKTMQIILLSSACPGPMADMWEESIETNWPEQLLVDVAEMKLAA